MPGETAELSHPSIVMFVVFKVPLTSSWVIALTVTVVAVTVPEIVHIVPTPSSSTVSDAKLIVVLISQSVPSRIKTSSPVAGADGAQAPLVQLLVAANAPIDPLKRPIISKS